MAYQVISQNNTTTTLADENGNIIHVPARVSLATSTDYTITKVNNTTATLEDGNGNIIRDVPCVAVLYGGDGGGGDQHNLGWYATQSALETAHPTAENGDWAIVGSTDTVWVWDSDTNAWKDTDQKGQVESVNGQTGTVVLTASDVGAATTAQGAKADTAVQPGDLATVATTGDYSDLINRPTNLVSTNTAQTISGLKTFSGDITLSGTTSIKNNTGGTNYTMLYRDASTIHVGASTSALKLEGSGTRPAYNNDSLALLSDVTAELPSQTGHSGEFLTTDGTSVSWAAVSGGSLPSQTGNAGKFLTTDGTDASWSDKPLVNTATGTNALTILGTATNQFNSINIGANSRATASGGVAVGPEAYANGIGGIGVGQHAQVTAQQGMAFGYYAYSTATKAIQFGSGTNSDANTVKFGNANGNYEMMSADGTIPTARLTKVNSTITLAAADWSSNTQTVTVNGVTSTSVVFVAPDPADTTDYVSAGILCTSQTTNSLTFTATTTPTNDIDVNVVCL